MIIKNNPEVLNNHLGVNKNIDALDKLIQNAEIMVQNWVDYPVLAMPGAFPIQMDQDASGDVTFSFNGTPHNITEHAFQQVCSKIGLPAAYMKKCVDAGKSDLAVDNYRSWSISDKSDQKENNNLLVRCYNGDIRAVLTDRYNVFDSSIVLNTLKDALDCDEYMDRFTLSQSYLSQDTLHLRFVDFNNPITVGGDHLHSGFVLSSSDIGSGALSLKYFLYRFACKNGIVHARSSGTLFRRTHLTDFRYSGINLFRDALHKIADLNQDVATHISNSQQKILVDKELDFYIEKARKELHIGKTGEENIRQLMDTTYDHSLWGLINSITEHAQIYSLDGRVDAETFAGKLLAAA